MAYTRIRGGRQDNADHWPGFVDALATLLLVVIFLLSLFAVAQFALGQALSGRDQELADVRARLLQLAQQLDLAEAEADRFEEETVRLRSSLVESQEEAEGLRGQLSEAEAKILGLEATIVTKDEEATAAGEQISLLELQISALNQQLASLAEALDASEARDIEQEAQIENLSQRLNAALAQKVQELARARSRFFEALTQALGDRADIQVVGDRFVFETDVLFASGSADLSTSGTEELGKIADVIKDISEDIPDDVDWLIRIDGHTDRLPIRQAYASNWELSAARAISVVNYFEALGVPSERLMAAGLGEHHPIDPGRGSESLARNRRIELKLDAR